MAICNWIGTPTKSLEHIYPLLKNERQRKLADKIISAVEIGIGVICVAQIIQNFARKESKCYCN